jgi:hypothetical protein
MRVSNRTVWDFPTLHVKKNFYAKFINPFMRNWVMTFLAMTSISASLYSDSPEYENDHKPDILEFERKKDGRESNYQSQLTSRNTLNRGKSREIDSSISSFESTSGVKSRAEHARARSRVTVERIDPRPRRRICSTCERNSQTKELSSQTEKSGRTSPRSLPSQQVIPEPLRMSSDSPRVRGRSGLYAVLSNMLGTVANDENVVALANLFSTMAVTAGVTTAAEVMKQMASRDEPCMYRGRVEP